jgi:hypothetical protein
MKETTVSQPDSENCLDFSKMNRERSSTVGQQSQTQNFKTHLAMKKESTAKSHSKQIEMQDIDKTPKHETGIIQEEDNLLSSL